MNLKFRGKCPSGELVEWGDLKTKSGPSESRAHGGRVSGSITLGLMQALDKALLSCFLIRALF